jgi:hypothetical protein
MNKEIYLDNVFLYAKDVMPFQGDEHNYLYPSPYDIPREVDLTTSEGDELIIRFVYNDREEAGPDETALDERTEAPIRVKRGRYSGKLMSLRVPTSKDVVPAVAERLKVVAPRQKRKNQELNFLLLSNILRKKKDELQPA